MCGLCGWFGADPPSPQVTLATMSSTLHHRGPDDGGLAFGSRWGLGFRRLSILDLSHNGHQPMSFADGRFWLAFNGEIYNHLELRADLERSGVRFRGSSDSEVLLHLLARSGADALRELNGMFALAFVDTINGTFLLARDRLGQKPLYLDRRRGRLRFASELKALLATDEGPRRVDLDAVAEFLQQGYVTGRHTILEHYERLAPGHVLTGTLAHPERARLHRYWSVPLCRHREEPLRARAQGIGTDHPRSATSVRSLTAERVDELDELLADAVRIRLRSDVPVGTFLSGGIDSGLVSSYAAPADPIALTVGFDDDGHDETELAALVARRWGLRHEVIGVEPAHLEVLDDIVAFFDEPFADPSALATMALCRAASAHGKVFLSGDGGDEAFGGYRSYARSRHYAALGRLPRPARSLARLAASGLPTHSSLRYQLTKVSLADAGFAAAFDGIPNDPLLSDLVGERLRANLGRASDALFDTWGRSAGAELTARQQRLDYDRYLPDDILVKMDRASMASSIEVRSPLLDYRLVEWAAGLDRAALFDGEVGKVPLRRLAARRLPARVQVAPKRGFGVPLDEWFRAPEGEAFLRDRLLGSDAADRGLWDRSAAQRLIEAHGREGSRSFGVTLWRVVVFDAWARRYGAD